MTHTPSFHLPFHSWLVIGPPRSGSSLHVDPLATAAWNALLAGRKRWALFPPGTSKELIHPREPGLGREAADWFARVWPRTVAPGWAGPRPIDVVQRPGETMYVPGGWLHAVMNLDLTVAVTQVGRQRGRGRRGLVLLVAINALPQPPACPLRARPLLLTSQTPSELLFHGQLCPRLAVRSPRAAQDGGTLAARAAPGTPRPGGRGQ